MTYAASDFQTLPPLPGWVTSARRETPEDVTFLSGAVLGHLHLVLGHPALPQSLLRQRLALQAAEAAMRVAGRPERAGDLRDAVAFLQPGDAPGPAGEVYLAWQRAVARPVSVAALHRAVPWVWAEEIAECLDVGSGAPVARAAGVVEAVLQARPRDRIAALILGNAALAQALGWSHLVPLLGLQARRFDPAEAHRAVVAAARDVMRVAEDGARRAARLREVAPKLRAKGAGAAVEMLLTWDAVPATAFTSLRSDRAARRFCDRLVALGAARELTGRETFRLYGL